MEKNNVRRLADLSAKIADSIATTGYILVAMGGLVSAEEADEFEYLCAEAEINFFDDEDE